MPTPLKALPDQVAPRPRGLARLADWLACKRCGLHAHRKRVVLGRGDVPARLMFVGIGPGRAENILGEAFVGRSGRLLERGIRDASTLTGAPAPTYYCANIVACRPCDGPLDDNRDPTPEEAVTCRPRLAETVRLVSPWAVVFLGELAAREGKVLCPDGVGLVHPAYILRVGGVESPVYRRWVRELSVVFKEVSGE